MSDRGGEGERRGDAATERGARASLPSREGGGDGDAERDDDPPATWRARAAATPGTAAITALCLLLFAVTLGLLVVRADDPWTALGRSLWSIDGEVLRALGALELSRIWLDGEWWRVLTAIFLHGSWIHLILNCTALISVGEWLERGIGTARALVIFGIAGIGGSLASLAWCEAPMVVGASAGILGMAGALWLARIGGSTAVRARIRQVSATSLAAMIVLCLGLGLVVPVIAQAGHLGGLVAGSLGFLLLMRHGVQRALPGSALIALFALSAVLGVKPSFRDNYQLFLGYRYLEDDRPEDALAAFEIALAARPEDPDLANAVAYHLALAERDLDRAEQLVDVAMAADPDNADYLDTKGWLACLRGDAERGLELLRRAKAASSREIPEITEHIEACAGAAPIR
ncbi:MAG: rhomboid family intramembrane serine protease [Myxococcales bacterium]|nr:rhomboid family intramembrane serine protease [Myxococcales bacterium]MCB9704489.1 rhomboid family intramembrane serine protease [Myxococcales bacterium]